MEDPHHEPYIQLLQQAAIQKRQRKDHHQRKLKDISPETSIELRNASAQLEAFCAYTSELTSLLPRAGFKLSQAGQKGKAREFFPFLESLWLCFHSLQFLEHPFIVGIYIEPSG